MLDIRTFGPQGGNVLYKALAHPLAAEALTRMEQDFAGQSIALYDPEDTVRTLVALYPGLRPSVVLVHDTEQVGQPDGFGGERKALVDLPHVDADIILALSFDDAKMRGRLASLLNGRDLYTLAPARLPDDMIVRGRPYLDKLNFATNFAFFRDDDRFSTRIVTANYWSNYGTQNLRYWLRLYDGTGQIIAQWEQPVEHAGAGITIDSADVRKRFGLPAFMGQLFIHVIGARGHDVVKYALDMWGKNGDPSLSVTHDANAWPSVRYATLPAPEADETLTVWVQNSHATTIPAGAITFNPMGVDDHRSVDHAIGPFETVAVNVGALFPDLAWPSQLEMRSGRHLVRPRYEIEQRGRTRIAHLNVERDNIRPDPAIRNFAPSLGRGFLLPFPILDPAKFESFVQPNPMSEALETLPVRLDIFDETGQPVGSHFLGNLPRDHSTAIALHDLTDRPGHADLVYDFRDGGEADGWLHALMRYRNRNTDHAAETSFGAHIFNTLMTWRSEPQSYSGPPPGLTTRLFLKLGHDALRSFCCLIHPASIEGTSPSETVLLLYAADGHLIAETTIHIQPSGSFMVRPHELFEGAHLEQAGVGGYVLIRDLTCRLFGYHGLENDEGGFSLDHMFGF
ncbi:hypothetical protein Gbth_001_036 [Gluconobacter thailandicus F149-1 = NBRC 100600]|uniref:Uncharacterized protein n=1 Tax=Gluconobacter thailandicus NBRC 3257 TaxID=1381097 RepID=A0ABQ0J0I3_GLUTH|nr:hypothetical protein [Gluconobacter thailandicus]KXV52891.1 hypothetical protein AD946_10240 [Gluconobacter thailandicus]GAC86753.1 hypothetical protein NBRC3255_0414 [Gluconobacter thailandicus NBRC 3255]GAD27939.1 hypothetical protein NBRC3257_2938 [Gluconobacter thailandicus NBRC 3257]GAN91813.1 hypothetical protein Gbth_001_036 [Gluconobacter thailandicus F149-1 = NBRC 100600]GBR59745.1 hypothetical protein AA100600_1467 [Gluconobacter thailandicus F149-1 = NBRC 100600]